ncbi:MAG: magnesium transporter [Neisseriaceae bacterium]|nr:magnesium transporter [Neisseriaceae bacterium]MBP6861022.1 magnesium transporter [Neisseriaceae bacterium]
MKHIKISLMVQKFLHSNDFDLIKTLLAESHHADVADALLIYNDTDIIRVLMATPIQERAELFTHFSTSVQHKLALALKPTDLGDLLAAMPHDDRADLYLGLPTSLKQLINIQINPTEVDDMQHLSSYPEDTAAAHMTTDFLYVRGDISAQEAIRLTRQYGNSKETIYYIYVVDAGKKLLGVMSLRDLLLADEQKPIHQIMRPNVVSIKATTTPLEAAQTIAHYDLLSLPVVDELGVILGIITADDAMDIQAQSSEETLYKTGGLEISHGANHLTMVNVKTASIWTLYRMRVIWLVVLVFGNVFSGAGIAHFEDTIMSYVVLVFFLPLLIDSGGNAGSQAATLMVRGLATGEVILKDWGKMIGKEVLVALALGLSMALAVALVGFVRGGVEIAMVVALSMVCIVIIGSLIGLSLPFILSKLKFDPATASAPLITSIADIVGVLIYFSIATQLLGL